MSVIIILFLLLFCSSISGFGVGQYSIKQAFFLGGGGGEGHSSFRYPWKGMQSESEHKIIGFI